MRNTNTPPYSGYLPTTVTNADEKLATITDCGLSFLWEVEFVVTRTSTMAYGVVKIYRDTESGQNGVM